eukprot:1955842-Amphidinium_carterae.1
MTFTAFKFWDQDKAESPFTLKASRGNLLKSYSFTNSTPQDVLGLRRPLASEMGRTERGAGNTLYFDVHGETVKSTPPQQKCAF